MSAVDVVLTFFIATILSYVDIFNDPDHSLEFVQYMSLYFITTWIMPRKIRFGLLAFRTFKIY